MGKVRADTVLAKQHEQREAGEKDHIIKGLKAMLLIFTDEQRHARQYLQQAIDYIEEK
jgi:hypothetical protein